MKKNHHLFLLRGGGGDAININSQELVKDMYEWFGNLGTPAALVAGAVVAAMYENIREGHLEARKEDSQFVGFAKKTTSLLLLSSFALELICLIVTTISRTMILSQDFSNLKTTATSPLGLLRELYKFEYLTARIAFLQGVLNWLAGVAVEHLIPRKGQGRAGRNMDRFVTASLTTLVLFLLRFYNEHVTFYSNYFHMLCRWFWVICARQFGYFRPLMLLYIPGLLASIYTLVIALLTPKHDNSSVKQSDE